MVQTLLNYGLYKKERTMDSISKKLETTLAKKPVKDAERLKRQQYYYHRLKKKGVLEQQTYNLKPISAI